MVTDADVATETNDTSDAMAADGSTIPTTQTTTTPAGAAFAYVANRGVSTPWLVPVDATGPGEALRLGPRRGAGYGLGQGDVSYPDITPDGTHIVVVFYPMATPSSSGTGGAVLFALAADGAKADAPVRLAAAEQLHALERVYRDGWMAYVDGQSVFAVRLDGSDADAPILVATAPAGQEIDGLRWVGSQMTLVYTQRSTSSGQDRKLFMSTVAPTGATPPEALHTAVGPAEWAVTDLPGDRIVASSSDDRLHAVSLTGSEPSVVLTPEGQLTGFVGKSSDGSRIVVVLRVTWKEERELVSVATDGSEADAPRVLTPAPLKSLKSIMSRDGTAVAWVGDSGSTRWAAYRADPAGVGPGEDPRITDWSTKKLHVTGFDAAADALVGSREDGAVLRYHLQHGGPAPPQVLALVEDVVNFSIPWPALSGDSSQVIYDANTPTGWHSWVVPLAGGEPIELPGPWYRDLLTPLGVLYHEYVNEGALFVADADGNHSALTPWHDTEIHNPHLVDDGRAVLYACETPSPGFYAASTKPSSDPQQVLVTPTDTESTPWTDWWSASPATVGAYLVRRSGKVVRSFALDGSDPEGVVLTNDSQPALALDPVSQRAVFVVGADLVSAPVDGAESPTVVMPIGEADMVHLSMLPGSDRVVVGLRAQGETSIYLAPVDGAAATAPDLVAAGLPGWFMGVAASATAEHIFMVLSVEATAVPHPDMLQAAPTGLGGSSLAGVAHDVAPSGYLLWHPGVWFDGGMDSIAVPGPVGSGDGVHVLLQGPDGLYSARCDGSQADAPVLLGGALQPLGASLSPDGQQVLLKEDQMVTIATIGEADSQRRLTAAVDGQLVDGRWTPDGGRVVFVSAPPTSFGKHAALQVVDADAESAVGTRLHAESFGLSAFAALTPDGETAVVGSTHGADHSLYLVPLDASGADEIPQAITPIDDVGERFLGFVPFQ